MNLLSIGIVAGMLWVPADIRDTFKLIEAGAKLSEKEAAELEQSLARRPNDRPARIQLLSYWTSRPNNAQPTAVKEGRSRHIFWLIQQSPKDDLFNTSSRIAAIYLFGPWADPVSFEKGKALWLEQIQRNGGDKGIRSTAAEWLELGDPEGTERLYQQSDDQRALGAMYARAVLGVVAQDYKTGDPVLTDNSRRMSGFAEKARSIIQSTEDTKLLVGAAFALGGDGGILFADGKITWDYTEVLKPLLVRARRANPNTVSLYAITDSPPVRGERPPKIIRIGGKVLEDKLLKKVAPLYPVEARLRGIGGTVRLNILIAPMGDVLKVVVESGPTELRSSAVEAVQQWRYAPTYLQGKPIFVVGVVDVAYQLTRPILSPYQMHFPKATAALSPLTTPSAQQSIWMEPGDVVEVEIEGIGVLRNTVAASA